MRIGLVISLIMLAFSAQASLFANPSYLRFQSVPVGQVSMTEYSYVSNFSQEPISTITVFDNCSFDFQVQHSCYFQLNPGQSCPVYVRFMPRSKGIQYCQITLLGSGVGSAIISVQGEGL